MIFEAPVPDFDVVYTSTAAAGGFVSNLYNFTAYTGRKQQQAENTVIISVCRCNNQSSLALGLLSSPTCTILKK
jgi:hypothetical protein